MPPHVAFPAEILDRGNRMIRIRTEDGRTLELALALVEVQPTDTPNHVIVEGPASAFEDCEVNA